MSVTPGYVIHDIDARSSSRVLARPGGQSNMSSIIGDPNARMDFGGNRRGAPAPAPAPQQQRAAAPAPAPAQSNQGQQRHAAFSAGFNNAAQNKQQNLQSSVFGSAAPAPQQQQQRPAMNAPSYAEVQQRQAHYQQQQSYQQAPPPQQRAPAGSVAPAGGNVHTSVRVRAPPGGASSISFG